MLIPIGFFGAGGASYWISANLTSVAAQIYGIEPLGTTGDYIVVGGQISGFTNQYVMRITAKGDTVWQKSINTGGASIAQIPNNSIAIDASNNVHVLAYSQSGTDAGWSVMKLNSSGVIQWVSHFLQNTSRTTQPVNGIYWTGTYLVVVGQYNGSNLGDRPGWFTQRINTAGQSVDLRYQGRASTDNMPFHAFVRQDGTTNAFYAVIGPNDNNLQALVLANADTSTAWANSGSGRQLPTLMPHIGYEGKSTIVYNAGVGYQQFGQCVNGVQAMWARNNLSSATNYYTVPGGSEQSFKGAVSDGTYTYVVGTIAGGSTGYIAKMTNPGNIIWQRNFTLSTNNSLSSIQLLGTNTLLIGGSAGTSKAGLTAMGSLVFTYPTDGSLLGAKVVPGVGTITFATSSVSWTAATGSTGTLYSITTNSTSSTATGAAYSTITDLTYTKGQIP